MITAIFHHYFCSHWTIAIKSGSRVFNNSQMKTIEGTKLEQHALMTCIDDMH